MLNSSEAMAPSHHTDVYECDFCGRSVYHVVAVEHAEREGDEPEIVTLCLECVRGQD